MYKDYLRSTGFYAWQPSTWPAPPLSFDENFRTTLNIVFNDSLLDEIANVIKDAPTLQHRGHVIALSILCAIDAISSYALKTDAVGKRYKSYILNFFPPEYQVFAEKIYKLYRNSITHSWNLFEAAMWPDKRTIVEVNGIVNIGLVDFFEAFRISVDNFIQSLKTEVDLQNASLSRYKKLKHVARS